MREPLEIASNIRDFIQSQNALRFPYQEEIIFNLLSELENALCSVEETQTENPLEVETPETEPETVDSGKVEESTIEEPTIKEPQTEEVVVKPTKRNTKK